MRVDKSLLVKHAQTLINFHQNLDRLKDRE